MNKNIYICPTPELQNSLGSDFLNDYFSGPAYAGSAGLDLYCSKDVVFSHSPKTYLIDTGVKMIRPQGYAGLITYRISIGKYSDCTF